MPRALRDDLTTIPALSARDCGPSSVMMWNVVAPPTTCTVSPPLECRSHGPSTENLAAFAAVTIGLQPSECALPLGFRGLRGASAQHLQLGEFAVEVEDGTTRREVAMATSKIMVIRHAEKPNGTGGVMSDGSANPEALTPTGWQRAGALVGLFVPPAGQFADPRLATPQTVYASGAGHHSKSLRPQQTVTPVAAKLGLTVNIDHPKGDEAALVRAATTIGGTVLIAWEHEAIPAIAGLVLGSDQGVPQHWPDDRFDLVWVFDRPGGQGTWSFAQVPQGLLAGDRAVPIALG